MESRSRVRELLRSVPRSAALPRFDPATDHDEATPTVALTDGPLHGPLSPSAPEIGEASRLGRYELLREIARSSDTVYEARDLQTGQRVAVKEARLAPSLRDAARRQRVNRFYREARAAGAMDHPNIVRIYDVGEDRGRYFLAMEYLEGETLRARLRTAPDGALSEEEAARIGIDLCAALQYAHDLGIIHRDIKPDNVFLTETSAPDGTTTMRVTLTDFGIARILCEEPMTTTGQFVGTPAYMSPEQLTAQGRIDARSDLFSLGVMLWEMVMGWQPFEGDSLSATLDHILLEPTPTADCASPALQTVLQRATAKSPDRRYHSAAEMRDALLSITEGRRHSCCVSRRGESAASMVDADAPAITAPRRPARSAVATAAAAAAIVVASLLPLGIVGWHTTPRNFPPAHGSRTVNQTGVGHVKTSKTAVSQRRPSRPALQGQKRRSPHLR